MNINNSCAIILIGGDILTQLKTLRINAGKSQQELADAVGVTQAAVSQWESGVSSPQVGKLLVIAHFLGCTVNDLLTPGEC